MQFLNQYLDAKYGGKETIPEEILVEGFELMKSIWGESNAQGLRLTDYTDCNNWICSHFKSEN